MSPPHTRVHRINVAVNADELAAIDLLIETEQVTLTEAVRRLIGYGDFVYRTTKLAGATIFVKSQKDGAPREVVLV